MKKMLLIAALIVGLAGYASAQVDGKAIGLRFGYGAELSYQQALSDANRLELDLGVRSLGYGALYLSGVYQWVWELSEVAPGFNWYAGVGGAVGLYYGLSVGVLGQIGIEYNLDIPIQLSLDWKPVVYFPGNYFGYEGVAFAVRYKF